MSQDFLNRDVENRRSLERIRRSMRVRLKRQAQNLLDDFSHVERVWNNARFLASGEFRRHQTRFDGDVLEAAVLLHVEIPQVYAELETPLDRILHNAEVLLHQEGLAHLVWPVCDALASVFDNDVSRSLSAEAQILHDADLLDELGAVGVFRSVLGSVTAAVPALYDVDDPGGARRMLDPASFAIDDLPTRLELLQQRLVTPTGQAEGHRRAVLMQGFYQEFLLNCNMLPL
jgi:HD superfamily phosphodiesterase